jgi:hypothetical protein
VKLDRELWSIVTIFALGLTSVMFWMWLSGWQWERLRPNPMSGLGLIFVAAVGGAIWLFARGRDWRMLRDLRRRRSTRRRRPSK